MRRWMIVTFAVLASASCTAAAPSMIERAGDRYLVRTRAGTFDAASKESAERIRAEVDGESSTKGLYADIEPDARSDFDH